MCFSFFFNDTATTEIYTLSLPDALPISGFTQARLAVLANRLQHAEANTSGVFLADEDRFVGEPGHRVKDRLRRRRAVRTDRLHGLEVEAGGEDRRTRPQQLLCGCAQIETPVNGRPEGLMTFRSGPAALGQQLKSSIQPGGQV